ncbi:HTH domain-containing protein [Enterococcus sp. BWT-B8]|uniref:helix-turn-helix transcriptional regulator n=1 Tax=Enterococcus sp. BWT-B8 TaxID=2885157 RepID=UPI001E35C424|nr:HTH domain-containing protein [Enterococcus sp. BWT-B8]MCB5951996.1 HTH domain-containing protein [Enterococcus sp. BWT-B8]
MKKVERVNTMIHYINNRAHFTISELMQEFNISRSTAIRDLQEVEQLGIPLEAEVGRSGGYSVLPNAVLPKIRFTDTEVKALFIAFMATKNLQLPYLSSRQSLTEKILGLISEKQQEELIFLNQFLFFEGTNLHNSDILDLNDQPHSNLNILIKSCLEDQFLLLYFSEQEKVSHAIYTLRLYNEKAIWNLEYFDLETEKTEIISIEQISKIKINPSPLKKWTKKRILKTILNKKKDMNVRLVLKQYAVQQFKKYHPYNYSLIYTDAYQSTAIFQTKVNIADIQEVHSFINWLLFLGPDCQIEQIPETIKLVLRQRMQDFLMGVDLNLEDFSDHEAITTIYKDN